MLQTISLFAPQLVLAFFASQLLSTGAFAKKDISVGIRYFAVGVLVLYAFIGFLLGQPTGEAFKGALIVDSYSHYMNLFLGLSAAAALMFSKSFFQTEKLDRFEFSVLVLYCTLGMSIMVSANTLLALYIGIEMQSLALYVMAAFNRDSLRASESGLKYFVLGALSSGLLLYGASLIYGFTGSLEFARIAEVITTGGATPGIIAGMVFLLCGLAFKISAAPFHMWTPDVYEGSPTPVTGFFAAAPKFAAMALIARLLVGPYSACRNVYVRRRNWCFDANKHQTSYGLFFNRQYGICACCTLCWNTGRRQRHADFHEHIYHHRHRYLCLYSANAYSQWYGRANFRFGRSV